MPWVGSALEWSRTTPLLATLPSDPGSPCTAAARTLTCAPSGWTGAWTWRQRRHGVHPGSGEEELAARWGGAGTRVGSGGGASATATLVREIQHGESVASIVAEAAQRTYESGGLEHAVISTQSGQRLLLQGGPGGMSFEGFALRVLGHTHPVPTGPSGIDFTMLQQTGQRSSWIYELFGGGLTRFRR